jgi:two-component system NtrC family response regulator
MKKILVIEDEELLCKVYSATLTELGYEVITANDGKTALELLQKEIPNLIVLDMKLPEISGIQLLKEIRKIDNKVPIIIATAYDGLKDDYEIWSSQVSDYIVKPVKLVELAEKIKKILGE